MQGPFRNARRKKEDGYCVVCKEHKKAKFDTLNPEYQKPPYRAFHEAGCGTGRGSWPCCEACWETVGVTTTPKKRCRSVSLPATTPTSNSKKMARTPPPSPTTCCGLCGQNNTTVTLHKNGANDGYNLANMLRFRVLATPYATDDLQVCKSCHCTVIDIRKAVCALAKRAKKPTPVEESF